MADYQESIMSTEVYIIPPREEVVSFLDEEDYMEKGKEWGLFNKSPKHQFLYKQDGIKYTVTIAGYISRSTYNTVVVQFEDGRLSCINPAYLKEMQSPSFGKVEFIEEDKVVKTEKIEKKENSAKQAKEKVEKKETAQKKQKLELPTEKVHFTAIIKEFSTVYNRFSEKDDEVVVFEQVKMIAESDLEIGDAWCGYSKTLKKLELVVGDCLEFDGKITDKKMNKEVPYKLNNPSKIVKL